MSCQCFQWIFSVFTVVSIEITVKSMVLPCIYYRIAYSKEAQDLDFGEISEFRNFRDFL